MDQSTFEVADPLIDEIAEIVDHALTSQQLAELRRSLAKLSEAIGSRYSVGLNIFVDVFDHERESTLPLLNTGLSCNTGKEPFRTWGDSTPQRYIVDGQIQVVPHDRCPKCWNPWDFKLENHSCSHCGTTLGDNCKVLLDTDTCPHCEIGKVSMTRPTCDQCGFEVDPALVTWG
jgi:hypothetical protein